MGANKWMRFLVAVGLGLGLGAGTAAADDVVRPTGSGYQATTAADVAITGNIRSKLEQSKVLRHSQVAISSDNGAVTVVGTVPSDFARDEVMEAVRSTPGVVRVDDQLRLDISSPHAPTRN